MAYGLVTWYWHPSRDAALRALVGDNHPSPASASRHRRVVSQASQGACGGGLTRPFTARTGTLGHDRRARQELVAESESTPKCWG